MRRRYAPRAKVPLGENQHSPAGWASGHATRTLARRVKASHPTAETVALVNSQGRERGKWVQAGGEGGVRKPEVASNRRHRCFSRVSRVRYPPTRPSTVDVLKSPLGANGFQKMRSVTPGLAKSGSCPASQ